MPATCGAAIEVPERVLVRLVSVKSPPRAAAIRSPGAVISGLSSGMPLARMAGPREEKTASCPAGFASCAAATLMTPGPEPGRPVAK